MTNHTKIVATIGPVTNKRESLLDLAGAGMGVARLNGSHNTQSWHAEIIALIRDCLPHIPILFDLPGRKVRTTALAVEPSFVEGDRIILTTDLRHDGREKIPLTHPGLHESLSPGDVIFADDGTLRFTVVDIQGRDIICRAECGGTLLSGKGINVPSVNLATELITPIDREMVAFSQEHGVDFVGVSFVESGEQIVALRSLIDARSPQLVAKVESRRGLENVEEIVAETDVIMIDRGDLSVETSLEHVALFQKRILDVACAAGKPVIVATEMLHTMIDNPFPTKAEVSDITNAVLDGCTAMMLSGETAVGAYPVEAVSMMRNIAEAAEKHVQETLGNNEGTSDHWAPREMGKAIAQLCRALPVTKIVAVTRTGYAARMISSHHPRQPILAVSDDFMAARSFNLLSGTEGIFVDVPFSRTSTDHIADCLEDLWRRGKLDEDDLILVSAVSYPKSGNRMNLLQTHHVGDLIQTLGWSSG